VLRSLALLHDVLHDSFASLAAAFTHFVAVDGGPDALFELFCAFGVGCGPGHDAAFCLFLHGVLYSVGRASALRVRMSSVGSGRFRTSTSASGSSFAVPSGSFQHFGPHGFGVHAVDLCDSLAVFE
jgi:hypothetical protein